MAQTAQGRPGDGPRERFPAELVYQAARLYYLDDATQAQVARTLGTSRPTVSRLLAQARAQGIVHIEVRDPRAQDTSRLARNLEEALGLDRVWVTSGAAGVALGTTFAPAVAEAVLEADLQWGDALVVSSGRTVHEVSQQGLPSLPGVLMAPTVGGQDEPEAYYQTNEITRRLAVKCRAQPTLLYAPAMPGPHLYDSLMDDPSVSSVVALWERARCALLGIGAPPATRTSLPSVMPRDEEFLRTAVGDICARPYDSDGQPIEFEGSDRLVAMRLEQLRRVEFSIGMAAGTEKVPSIRAATTAGYINRLVTNLETALALLGDDDSGEGSATG